MKPKILSNTYENSQCHKATTSCNEPEYLRNRLSYSEKAVTYWQKMGDKEQEVFFQDDVNLINWKLALATPKERRDEQ